jgi:glycosyltransferase involved in cell wall biosynthesis
MNNIFIQIRPIILVLTKDATSRGGVSGYYNLFFEKVHEQDLAYERFTIGSRSKDYYKRQQKLFNYFLTYVGDVFRLVWCLVKRPEIFCIQLNPSLIPVPLIRDGFFLVLAKIFGRKGVVFIRGWREDVAQKISLRPLFLKLFLGVFGRSDKIIVLAENFRDQLEKMGIPRDKIIVSRTMFNGILIQPRKENRDQFHFLFLSRISSEKGIFEIVEAARILKMAGLQFSISFHGHGAQADTIAELKNRIVELGVDGHIQVGDFLEGLDKYRKYAETDVFLLPSYHEGCPNSILEAMGSGCFIISTNAGAMKELVQDGINGNIVRTRDAYDLAQKMAWAINNRQSVERTGGYNQAYAFNEFESRVIINQIITVHRSLLKEQVV